MTIPNGAAALNHCSQVISTFAVFLMISMQSTLGASAVRKSELVIPVAAQRNGDLAAVVVGRDGVPYISWQQQGQPWHSFERIAP